ncbi:hypothetical protein EGR_06193 [Echinococcus granulosus]|uniref:Uncharacterized protein n=1 Tax=Echinococcus granulosus TaxID=6210 RepID=W6UZC7_ECHGR|nr:hypothetical protein EGR_06193 [Echinococcus granulosus]EUB58974.1 hypothetical protein EGR_06193 [Echinococcus granulosus]
MSIKDDRQENMEKTGEGEGNALHPPLKCTFLPRMHFSVYNMKWKVVKNGGSSYTSPDLVRHLLE